MTCENRVMGCPRCELVRREQLESVLPALRALRDAQPSPERTTLWPFVRASLRWQVQGWLASRRVEQATKRCRTARDAERCLRLHPRPEGLSDGVWELMGRDGFS